MTALTTALLYLDGVSVSFDGFRALNNLSFMIEPGEMRARLAEYLAGVGFDLTGNELHQRGLARAVASEQAHALAGIDLEIHVVEHGRATEGMGDIEKT